MGKVPVIFNIQNIGKYPPKKYSAEAKAKYMAKRAFYDMTADYNIQSYIANDKKVQRIFTIEQYMTKEKTENSGMFNLKKVLDKDDIVDLKKRLAASESIIWHGFISLDDETSLAFQTQEPGMRLCARTFPTLWKKMGLDPDNVDIFISLHSDTDNRHLHFCFFEKEPRRLDKNGKKCYTRKGQIKKCVIEDMVLRLTHEVSQSKQNY